MIKKNKEFKNILLSGLFCRQKANKPETESAKEKESVKEKADEEKEKPETEGIPIGGESKEEAEKLEEKELFLPNMPEKSPDAMSLDEFKSAYKKVELNPKERQKLIMEQFAKGAFDKEKYGIFEPVEIKSANHSVTVFAAKRRLRMRKLDESGNEITFEVPLDGPTSKAIGDMMNCTMPTKWLSDKIYNYAKAKKRIIPLYDQSQFAKHSDDKMRRLEYMEKQQNYSKYKAAFAKMPDNELVAGYFKDIIHPVAGMKAHVANGIEIYGGYDINGNLIQPVSGRHHAGFYIDYSHGPRYFHKLCFLDGKPTKLRDFLIDPEMAREFKFKPLDIDLSYDYDTWDKIYDARWAKGFVADYLGSHPPKEMPQILQFKKPPESVEQKEKKEETAGIPITEEPPGPTPAEQALEKPEYVEPVQQPGGEVYGTAPAYAAPAPEQPKEETVTEEMEIKNRTKTLVLGDSLSEGAGPLLGEVGLENVQAYWERGRYVKTMRQIFEKIPEEQCRGATLYVLGGGNDLFDKSRSIEDIQEDLSAIYKLAKERGMKVITATYPPMGNSKYVGKEAGSVKNEKEFRDRWEKLNNWILKQKGAKDNSGAQIGPDEVIKFHEIFADPKDKYLMREDIRAKDGVHMHPKGYNEMAVYIKNEVFTLNKEREMESKKS